MEISKDTHEVIDSINLSLTVEEARQVSALLTAVSINFSTDVFDNVAEGIAEQLNYEVPMYEADENGEFGPVQQNKPCGCKGLFDDSEPVSF